MARRAAGRAQGAESSLEAASTFGPPPGKSDRPPRSRG